MEMHGLNSDDMEELIRKTSVRISEVLPRMLSGLFSTVVTGDDLPLQFECNLIAGRSESVHRLIASEKVLLDLLPPIRGDGEERRSTSVVPLVPENNGLISLAQDKHPRTSGSGNDSDSELESHSRRNKRRATGGLRIGKQDSVVECLNSGLNAVTRRLKSDNRVFPQRRKKLPDNPKMQPSTLEKFITGVWDNIFSSMKMDPAEVIEQWQAIEGSGQPKLLTDIDNEVAAASETLGAFGRMNILTRKISQTSRTCRSLEVLVQSNWIQCFDSRVIELEMAMLKEKAKKTAIDEACVDFQWTEKELRNKMGIWRGYHDIQKTGGWVALVFAGMGLYRFCKYRVSFNEETFKALKALRHRFEVAADTLHPRWRTLLAIVGASTACKYRGHPHDWVVCSSQNEAVPIAATYAQWDKDWKYTHIDHSTIDEDAWGLYDPRIVVPTTNPASHICSVCEQRQSDDAKDNSCTCFPNIYGSTKAGSVAVQVFRTPNGKNNGLIACCPFERGAAIGEFVGEVTSGLSNLDVMVGQTDRASYQLFQGRQGNHTRFVNHSCQPNSQYERFIWLGTQRIVLVSKGIEAGEEITSDYSDTYWRVGVWLPLDD